MANTSAYNVIRVDTSANFTSALGIDSIKYIGNASGTAVITRATLAGDSSGKKLWEESGASNVYNPEVEIVSKDGVYVAVTNGAVVYLYLE